jgi:hypothetical protein
MKDVQTAGEAFSPPKRTSSISKHEIFSLLYIFWVIFALLDPDRQKSMRIRIRICNIGL